MQKKIQEWIDIAEEDLSTAELCIQGNKYLWAMVMCQQSVEKILKAIYLKQTEEIPPKIHNLKLLLEKIGLVSAINNDIGNVGVLLEDLVNFYIGSRYPDKRKKLIEICNKNYAKTTYDKTKQVYLWLKNRL